MVRRATFCMAVVALIFNALTPKTSVPQTSSRQSVVHLLQYSGDALVSIPEAQHQLRPISRAFSCPPLPVEMDSHGETLELPTLKIDVADLGNDFAHKVTVTKPASILRLQCRLNI